MTKEESQKVDAEIANLNALTAKLTAETARINSEIPAWSAKFAAETAKISNENRWYPAVVASGATLAIVAIVKVFL